MQHQQNWFSPLCLMALGELFQQNHELSHWCQLPVARKIGSDIQGTNASVVLKFYDCKIRVVNDSLWDTYKLPPYGW